MMNDRSSTTDDADLQRMLTILQRKEIDAANDEAVKKILYGHPVLETVKPAKEVIKMPAHTFLHAGPPISWQEMCGPMKGAMIGACIYEKLAETPEHAERLLSSREINFAPCHHYNAVAPMAGVISPSMHVFVIRNKTYRNTAYSNMNEGLGRVLRFGAYGKEVINRLRWMEETLGPVLKISVEKIGGVDLKNLTARALNMGDECHNRNMASTSLFLNTIFPALIASGIDTDAMKGVSKFLQQNDHFFLNLSMGACKAILDASHGVRNCTIVTLMSRNGTEFGIKISGHDEWFTAKAPQVDGHYFHGYGAADASPDLGDSSITETCGLGAFAMAAAPAITQFVGVNPTYAINCTKEMYKITLKKNPAYCIPNLNFSGVPTGIDLRKILVTGILPIINTGIAHRLAGIGQIGAGMTKAPKECFLNALRRCAEFLR